MNADRSAEIAEAQSIARLNLIRLKQLLMESGRGEADIAKLDQLLESWERPESGDRGQAILSRIQSRFNGLPKGRSAVDELIAERRLAFWREELESA